MQAVSGETIIVVTKIIALIIFGISCVTIYHNTNSYEPSKRIIYIIVGTLIIYILTSFIFGVDFNTKGINESAVNDTLKLLGAMKLIFTPINSMVLLASMGNIFGKVKDKVYGTDKAGKKCIIVLVIFILLLVFEKSYIGDFIGGLLG